MSSNEDFRPNTLKFRECVARMKSKGKSMMWLAQTMQIHHQTLASWHCDQRRIPEHRLDEVQKLVATIK